MSAEIEVLKDIVGSIGFPILMVLILWRYLTNESKSHTAAIVELTNVVEDLKEYLQRIKS